MNEEQEQEMKRTVDLIERLTGAQIEAFGANEDGEIYICTVKDGKSTEIAIGVEDGQVTVYELQPEGDAP